MPACQSHPQPTQPIPTAGPLAAIEAAYKALRYDRDQIDVTRNRGADRNLEGVLLARLLYRARTERLRLDTLLKSTLPSPLSQDDRRALAQMQRAWDAELGTDPAPEGEDGPGAAPDCDYDAPALAARPAGMDSLGNRIVRCYGWAAQHVTLDSERLDRLTVLGLLGRTDDADRRKRLFLALEPVWASVNGDDGPGSPYRTLARLRATSWQGGESPLSDAASALNVDPDSMEAWITRALEGWRRIAPADRLEPWDFYYATGEVSRLLSPRIPRDRLLAVNDRYYHSLGADPRKLGLHYDLEPRVGKYPVAFTTFGARGGYRNGDWVSGEYWIFTYYPVGGFDNLVELLHETGHGIHLAAIRTRPAFNDWPDSDTFTEAVADVAALEAYEPAWQQRFLGDSAPLRASLRAKYAGILMDLAWGLFEIRLYRDPSLDPNRLWTDITGSYLRIRPHPELSWWAMRGQLLDAPGYMLNYALGAFLTADLRAQIRARHGPFVPGDASWYPWISARLYRFGLQRPARDVVVEFLGRPLSPGALLDDLARAGGSD
ncbi:MAG: hypothetical protein ACREMO_01965 [Gemmatimonadales bacterium]